MGLKDELAVFFKKSQCKKLIKYDTRVIQFKSLGAEYQGAKFSVGDFATEVRKIRQSSEYATMIDDYQYNVCRLTWDLPKNARKKYVELQIAAIGLLSSLRATLAAFKEDPKGMKKELYKIVSVMQDFMAAPAKKWVRSMRAEPARARPARVRAMARAKAKGELEPQVQVPRSPARTVSQALKISGLRSQDASKLAEVRLRAKK